MHSTEGKKAKAKRSSHHLAQRTINPLQIQSYGTASPIHGNLLHFYAEEKMKSMRTPFAVRMSSRGLSEEFGGMLREAEQQLLLYNIFISHQLAALQVRLRN